ncbi:MAG: phosphate acyltransferase PlsX [Candidatus Zixiibacteriota bacterium]
MTGNGQYTVALDVMGADKGPGDIIDGGISAALKLGDRVKICLVGHKDKMDQYLVHHKSLPANVSIHHAESEVPMHIAATDGVKLKDSSISVGLRMVQRREADAFVSPGNTGAVMASSLLTLGRIEGVSRPAITAAFPTSEGRPAFVLDVGANADCKPQHLSQFAVMGSVYAQAVLHLEAPRVGLISIGEERSKGNELIFAAQELLKHSKINFVGNIEGRDIMAGTVDVAVTDGFTGNILLKFAESIQPLMMKAIKRQIQTNIFSRMGAYLMLPFLKRMKRAFDYAQYGGAPLLGVNGIVIICHGSSNSIAIGNAVLAAYEMANRGIKERIHDELITNHFGRTNGSQTKRADSRDGIVYSAAPDDQR